MISTKACSLVAKDLGLSIEGLSKAVKGKLPRGATAYDRVVVAGEKAGNAFQTEILTFKNSNGEIIKRTFDKVGDEGTSFTVRNYQKTLKGKFIHTNNFVNNKLVGTKQETIALTKYTDANVVTRTCVSKEIGEWGSLDKHSIGEYVDKGRSGRKVAYDFVRDKNGLLMRIPSDEFASIYLNTNKSEVARDLTQIYSKRFGFDEMPKVGTFQHREHIFEGEIHSSGGFFKSWGAKDGEFKLTKPEINLNTRYPKHEMVKGAAHENWHMRQWGKIVDGDGLTVADNAETRMWWQKYLDKNPKPQPNSRYAKKIEQYDKAWENTLTNSDCKNMSYDEYRKDILEIEAFKKGDKAQKEYMSRIKHPRTGLISKFNGADWERLHA